jgi:RNA polymerase sigma-70 factor (ECF subfamily)
MSQSSGSVIVVGAGLGGLLSACLLARAGHRVRVCGAGDVGGRARSLLLGGLPVNPGPRALYRGGHLDKFLKSLGIRPRGFRPPATGGLGLLGGALHALPSSPASLLSTALLHGAARKDAALALARVTVGAARWRTRRRIRRGPCRPWLVTVTMNVARDQLRRRRRRGHPGPWLPGVVDDAALDDAALARGDVVESAEAKYGRRESVTFAFLVALEALTPLQRAVLVLREVFDFSGRETSQALGISEDNVKTVLSRATRALAKYDAARVVPDDARAARDAAALQKFMTALATDDVDAALALLRDDVVAVTDGGVYPAARVPLVGPQRVLAVLRGLARQWPPDTFEAEFVVVNALPALVLRALAPRAGYAPVWLVRVDTDDDGRITAVHSLGAPEKLAGLPSSPSPSSSAPSPPAPAAAPG